MVSGPWRAFSFILWHGPFSVARGSDRQRYFRNAQSLGAPAYRVICSISAIRVALHHVRGTRFAGTGARTMFFTNICQKFHIMFYLQKNL
jgi:hypothetical protein